ncbi:MAG: glycosyltransferase family 4 protein, partial [Thermoanaerobaculia bacterium]
FTFLSIFDTASVLERKNPLGAVRAFARAFGADPRVKLILQVSNAGRAPELFDRLAEAAAGARVEVRAGALARASLEALLAACDAYVSLHRAEGFGLPIAEAMAAGKPVVATSYSGNTDYLDERTGFPVRWRYVELPQSIRDYDRGTRWAEPDEEHAAKLLRRVFEDRGEAARRAGAGRRRIAELYSQEAAGRRVAQALASLRARLRKTA